MIWHLIKYWIAFILASFYKRIQGNNVRNLHIKGPAIIVMNHPNAFTDPIAISYVSYPLRLKYMARGDAFKPGITAWLLEQIGIVPIFRIQDGGVEGLKKNDAAYARVNELLKKNSKIIVFAEGLCVQERRLRPLKKGVARMVFGSFEALNHDKLVVIPIGVNYSQPDKFRSNVFYNVGDPIPVKDFIDQYRENPARANNALLHVIEPKLKALITHINDKNYDEVVMQVEELCKKNSLVQQGLNFRNLSHDFIVLKQLTEKVNVAVEKNRAVVDEFKSAAKVYFTEVRANNLRDWLIDPLQNKRVSWLTVLCRILILIAVAPVYIMGMTGNYLPYKLTEKLTKKILKKNVEFYSSIAIGIAMVFFLVTYLLIFFISAVLSPNILWAFLICIGVAMCAGVTLYYHPVLLKTLGMIRALLNKNKIEHLSKQRQNLISLINKF